MNNYQTTNKNNDAGTTESQRGLTTFQSEVKKKEGGVSTPSSRSARAINEQQMDLNYGPDSAVLRDTLKWKNADVQNTILATYKVPTDLLALGGVDVARNLQNMPFDRFIFWEGDVEVLFQLVGQPFQQGMLIAYWMPLVAHRTTRINRPFAQCVYLSPNDSSFVSMRLPFRFPLPAMNTLAMEAGEETLGILRVEVFFQLRSVVNTEVTVNVFSKFPNSKFTIPRPPTNKSYRALSAECYNTKHQEDQGVDETEEQSTEMESVTGVDRRLTRGLMKEYASKETMTTNFKAQGVLDSLLGVLTGTGQKENPNPLGGISNIALDNPMVASTSAPVVNQYSGLSKSNGPEPTTSMQLHPDALYRVHQEKFDPEEHKISHILSRETELTEAYWKADQVAGAQIFKINLNSIFRDTLAPNPDGGYPALQVGANVALLNMFTFWKADIVFRIVAVKTQFHVGRLRATIAYGARSLDGSESTLYYNQILDFTGSEQSHEIRIPFNSNREYLRTYEGDHAPHVQQNYSLGFFGLYVANQLQNAPTVVDNVDVAIFVHYENVHVAVPRACPIVRFITPQIERDGFRLDYIPSFVAQGMEDTKEDVISTGTLLDDGSENDQAAVTETEIVEVPRKMCSLKPGEKFEYEVESVLDLMRRNTRVRVYDPDAGSLFRWKDDLFLQGNPSRLGAVYSGPAKLSHPLNTFYAGWAGGIKYRFFSNTVYNPGISVKYFPTPTDDSIDALRPPLVGALFDPEYEDRLTLNTLTYGSSYNALYGSFAAQEQAFPLANQSYIDVHVPFQSEYDFVSYGNTTVPGLIALAINTGDVAELIAYTSAADDYAPGILVPPQSCYIQPYVADLDGVTVSQLKRRFALWFSD